MMRDETIKMTFIYMMNMDANKTEVITADPHFNRAVIFQIIIFDLYNCNHIPAQGENPKINIDSTIRHYA